jgi:hypothetical protein
VFIDEWFEGKFYKKLPIGFHAKHCFGQIFWTHTYYPHEDLQLWRPVVEEEEPSRTTASHFQIVNAGADAFNRGFPLHTPPLRIREEFVVIRAKRRPVVLVQSVPPIAGGENRGYKGRFARPLCLVAQAYSIVDQVTGRTKFELGLVDRVRMMEFPQIMFLPPLPGFSDSPGMLRLDQLQSVFTPHMEATPQCLSDEVQNILKCQLRYLLTGEELANDYTVLRELLIQDTTE